MFKKGDGKGAIEQWTVVASWAVKEAQYNLGIAYYKGQGAAANRPLGVVWLAVAAERRNPEFCESLAAAWMESSADEQRRANELYADLLQRYGDQATLVRAKKHFDSDLAQVTGSWVDTPGSVSVWSPTYGNLDVAVFRRELQTLADQNFGAAPKGTVRVGEIQIPSETGGE